MVEQDGGNVAGVNPPAGRRLLDCMLSHSPNKCPEANRMFDTSRRGQNTFLGEYIRLANVHKFSMQRLSQN